MTTFLPFSPPELQMFREKIARSSDLDRYRMKVTNDAVVIQLLGRLLATIDAQKQPVRARNGRFLPRVVK